MKNEGWDDISEGWGGLGCSESFGSCVEGDNVLGGIEGIPTGVATETI